MNKELKKGSIKFEIDFDRSRVIGKIIEGTGDLKINDINPMLIENINQALHEMNNWVDEFNELVNSNKHKEAYELFKDKKGTLEIYKGEILEDLLKLNKTTLTKGQRKEFIIFLIFIASKESKFDKIEIVVDEFLTEFNLEIEPELRQNIILTKANAAAQNKKLNVANNYYKNLIEDPNTAPNVCAYAYRGLSLITAYQDDIFLYHQKSADKFLEVGIKKEAVKDLVYISKLYEKKNPKEALKFIDIAISLIDDEKNLNKEYAAGLYHKKASYLFSINKKKEALKSVETACKLRENLIGNEYEKYSSYSLAKGLCEILKLKKKTFYYSNKIDLIAPKIINDEFKLQQCIEDCISKNNIITSDLLNEIEKSNFAHLKYSSYLYNSMKQVFPFEERINWLDKAKLVLNEKDFDNQHYSLLYFTIGEVFRQNNKIDEAVNNYEYSLDYNPIHYQAIQNCAAILWENKKWIKSKEFFLNQIEKLGESPILCYALGRSYFELKKYKQAFTYFKKANGRIKGINILKYIEICIKKDSNIELDCLDDDSQKVESSISLESFKLALEKFSESVSTNSRMHFWKNESGKYTWNPKPEEKGKHLLITALETKYGKDSIEIIQERPAGAGIIDLYLSLHGGLKIVVELKICGGSGYSSSYALSGKDQLLHYLKNSKTNIGFLIVFDGRLRDFNKGFKPIQTLNNFTIFTTVIDMQPKVLK